MTKCTIFYYTMYMYVHTMYSKKSKTLQGLKNENSRVKLLLLVYLVAKVRDICRLSLIATTCLSTCGISSGPMGDER